MFQLFVPRSPPPTLLSCGGVVAISRHAKAEAERSRKAKTILDWTFRAAEGGDLRTVRALHSGCCGRCGRKLTVPESIDTGLGPVCARS